MSFGNKKPLTLTGGRVLASQAAALPSFKRSIARPAAPVKAPAFQQSKETAELVRTFTSARASNGTKSFKLTDEQRDQHHKLSILISLALGAALIYGVVFWSTNGSDDMMSALISGLKHSFNWYGE